MNAVNDCRGLRGESDIVCALEQVLHALGHRHLGVCFSLPQIASAVQTEEESHPGLAQADRARKKL